MGGEGGDGGGSFSHGSHLTLVSTGYSEVVFVPVPGDYYTLQLLYLLATVLTRNS